MTNKSYIFVLCLITSIMLWSCNEPFKDEFNGDEGSFTLNVINDDYVTTKAAGDDVSQYEILIYRGKEQYARFLKFEDMPQPAKLKAGDYTLKAVYGDNPAIAFDAPLYIGTQDFTIIQNETNNVEVVCKLANSKLSIKVDDNFKDAFQNYYATITTSYHSENDPVFIVKQDQIGDNPTPVYFKPGDIKITLHITKADGSHFTYGLPVIKDVQPREHYIVTLKGNSNKIPISVAIHEELNDVNETYQADESWLIKDAPVIKAAFDMSVPLTTYQDIPLHNSIAAAIKAESGIKELKLNVNSPELNADGIPSTVMFSQITPDITQKLNNWGITWTGDVIGDFETVFRFTGLQDKLSPNGDVASDNIFSIEVIDNYDQNDILPDFTIQMLPLKFEMPTMANLAMAKYAFIPTIKAENVISGDFSKMNFSYEIKEGESGEWMPLSVQTDMQILSDLTPNTTYQVRCKFKTHYSEPVSFTTESILQIPDAGLDNWQSVWAYKGSNALWIKSLDIYEQKPFAEGTTQYWFTRNALTTSQRDGQSMYYTSYSGTVPVSGVSGQAAEISTIGWGNGNTFTNTMTGVVIKNKTAGMLFLGKGYSYTLDGDTFSSENCDLGIDFNSRPSDITFQYKFAGIENESFKAYAVVENRESGTAIELGRAELESNAAKTSFTSATLNFTYDTNNLKLKPTHLTVVFLSSSSESPAVTNIKGSNNAFEGYSDSKYVGSVLTVDDIQLGYDKAPLLK